VGGASLALAPDHPGIWAVDPQPWVLF